MKNLFYKSFLITILFLLISNFTFSQTTFTFGVELMRAGRELGNGVNGRFDRLQFSAKYNFSFSGTINN